MHEVLINRLGGLSLPRKSVVRLTDRPDMTLDAYRGRKTTIRQYKNNNNNNNNDAHENFICVWSGNICFRFYEFGERLLLMFEKIFLVSLTNYFFLL